ncbi:hypothetical protein [Arthrobacter sp. NicSoilB8]|uniref:hypothetical protein n=1 Tax=Arthrobacter sp. NicSoilB8 TaxID=2830998 RepID=UPI001CC7AE9A|nr:hypothetical protein [Arthrobacter sp. NicSoilB8]BCW71874.1 hypothetical protein NicSoilB8_29180 [Arthrobacter sp. NicSoilB8]
MYLQDPVIPNTTRRSRRRPAPVLAAGFAVLAILLCLADGAFVGYTPDIAVPALAATLIPALAVLVVIGAGLARQKIGTLR